MFMLSCVQDPVATARGSETALMDVPGAQLSLLITPFALTTNDS